MRLRLALLLLLGPLLAASYRLTEQENDALQKTCGRKAFQRKVLNGEMTSVVDHPWAVALYIRHPRGVFMGPATIISPRHILTFNTIRAKNDTLSVLNTFNIDALATCEGRHLVLPKGATLKFDVDTRFYTRRQFDDTVEKITIVDGCRALNEKNPVIVELHEDMRFNRNHRPACVSNSADNWLEQEQFTMFGVNKTGTFLLSAQLATVPCDEPSEAPMSCAKATREDQGLCSGDFGGSAVASIGGRSTVLGVYSKGNVRCRGDPRSHGKYKFVNIGYFRKSLCELTGVCVEAPASEEDTFATTTPSESSEEEVPAEVTESSGSSDSSDSDDEEQKEETLETSSAVGIPIFATEEPESSSESIGEPIYATEEPSFESSSSEESSEEAVASELETIVAETFEKLKLNGSTCSSHDDENEEKKHKEHVKNIHIHIHLK